MREVAFTRGPVVRTGRAATSLRERTAGVVLCTDGEVAVRTVEREDVGRDVVERLRSPDELGELLYDLDVLGELLYDLDELGVLLYDLDEPADGELYERLDDPPL